MRLSIVGSRNIKEVNIEAHIPVGVTEIVSGWKFERNGARDSLL